MRASESVVGGRGCQDDGCRHWSWRAGVERWGRPCRVERGGCAERPPSAARIGTSRIGRIPCSSILHFAIEGGSLAAAYSTLQSTEGTLRKLCGRNKTIMIHFSDRTCRARLAAASSLSAPCPVSQAVDRCTGTRMGEPARKCTSAGGSSPQPLNKRPRT